MALRILSGFVNITSSGPKNGQVRIRFNPHERIDGDAPVIEQRTIGPAGRYVSTPAKLIALRQITLLGFNPLPDSTFRLGDTINRDQITITWNGSGPAFSEEVSYMIVGEVPDPAPRPDRRPARSTPSRTTSRPKRPPRGGRRR
jgi:hypothetical protein